MPSYDRLITFLEDEAQFLRHRIETLEEKGWPVPESPGGDEPPPDSIEATVAGYKVKLAEIESHIADLRQGE
jgi:hypothetical protein